MPDIGMMFANFQASSIALMNLLGGYITVVMGIWLSSVGIMKFRELNEGKVTLKTPISYMVVGAFMVGFPMTVSDITNTMVLGDNSGAKLFSQVTTSGALEQSKAAIEGVLFFFKLLGHIAFLRGLWMMKAATDGKEGAFGKGMMHILGGAAAINIDKTIMVLTNTFTPGLPSFFG